MMTWTLLKQGPVPGKWLMIPVMALLLAMPGFNSPAQEQPGAGEADELERAYLILAEVMREIEGRGLQSMTRDGIFRGMLRALAEVVPEKHEELVPSAAGRRADGLLDALGQAIDDLQATGEPGLQPVSLVSRMLNQFLEEELDRYCEFVDPELAEKLAARDQSLLVGVGMRLEENEDGTLRCFPYPGESADLEGVQSGDKLLALDGRPVEGRSRFEVGDWFAGEDGSRVTVKVRSDGGEVRELSLLRRLFIPPAIEITEDAGGNVIRIRRFQPETADELRKILARLPAGRRLVFDLRGCQGGRLEAAIGCASLLLPKGSHIADIRGVDGVERHQSATEVPYRASLIVLRQDAGTASAAELFAAALLGNSEVLNVRSQGGRSYGKGTVQTVVPLQHGGNLVITTHTVSGPGGMSWEGHGIEPSASPTESEGEGQPSA